MEDLVLINEEIGENEAHLEAVEENLDANEENIDLQPVFVPQIIGLGRGRDSDRVLTFYQKLCDQSNLAIQAISEFLGTEVQIDDFLEFLKTKKLEFSLLLKYAKEKKLDYPGFRIEKLIENDSIDYPQDALAEAVNSINGVRTLLSQLETRERSCGLYFPIRRLYRDNKFVLDPDFTEIAVKHFQRLTTCQQQNQLLDLLEDFAEVINKFHYYGFLNLQKNPTLSLEKLIDTLEFDPHGGLTIVGRHALSSRFLGVPSQTTYTQEFREYKEIFE